jgi:N-acetylmuramoyl-L-alanine amidase
MIKLLWKFSLLQFLLVSCSISKPIEEIVPHAFETESGIMAQSKEVAGLDIYRVAEFSDEEKNRNHYGDRGATDIKYLLMHYTVCDFPKAMRLFTSNIPDGRVSAYYVITEAEKERDILGGMVFQVVPEEKTAWHAGISC